MIQIDCLFCNKSQDIKILYRANFLKKISPDNYSARLLPERVHYQLVQCRRCSLIFSTPIFAPEKINKLYQEGKCTYTDQIPYLAKTYLQLFKKTDRHLPKNPRVLEIGCGNGFFLDTLKKQGISNVVGIEPGRKIVAMSSDSLRKNIIVDVFRKDQFPKQSFDFVCLFHVLDHMVNPHEVLGEIHKLLKKNGIVLIVVHDTQGLSVKIFGELSPIFDIQHTYLFNKKTLKRLVVDHSFQQIETFNVTNTFQLSYWLKTAPFSETLKQFLLPTLNKSRLGQIPIPFSGGNIGIIAKRN